jgi:hypothetical protein
LKEELSSSSDEGHNKIIIKNSIKMKSSKLHTEPEDVFNSDSDSESQR